MGSAFYNAPAAHDQEETSQAGVIVSTDIGPLSICVVCRNRIAVPCQYYCTECISADRVR